MLCFRGLTAICAFLIGLAATGPLALGQTAVAGRYNGYVRKLSEKTGKTEEEVRKQAVEALRRTGRFSESELKRIGRGDMVKFEPKKQMEIVKELAASRAFHVTMGFEAVRDAKLAVTLSKEFEELAGKNVVRPARLSKEEIKLREKAADKTRKKRGVQFHGQWGTSEYSWAKALIEKGQTSLAVVEALDRNLDFAYRAKKEVGTLFKSLFQKVINRVLYHGEKDPLDRHIARLRRRGKHEEATLLHDIKGILGKRAALAVATASPAGYVHVKDLALTAARRAMRGDISVEIAENTVLEQAAKIKLVELEDFISAIRHVSSNSLREVSAPLLKHPDAQIRLRAAVALAVATNPQNPNITEAIVIAGEGL